MFCVPFVWGFQCVQKRNTRVQFAVAVVGVLARRVGELGKGSGGLRDASDSSEERGVVRSAGVVVSLFDISDAVIGPTHEGKRQRKRRPQHSNHRQQQRGVLLEDGWQGCVQRVTTREGRFYCCPPNSWHVTKYSQNAGTNRRRVERELPTTNNQKMLSSSAIHQRCCKERTRKQQPAGTSLVYPHPPTYTFLGVKHRLNTVWYHRYSSYCNIRTFDGLELEVAEPLLNRSVGVVV